MGFAPTLPRPAVINLLPKVKSAHIQVEAGIAEYRQPRHKPKMPQSKAPGQKFPLLKTICGASAFSRKWSPALSVVHLGLCAQKPPFWVFARKPSLPHNLAIHRFGDLLLGLLRISAFQCRGGAALS